MLIWVFAFLHMAAAEEPLTYEAALSQALAANPELQQSEFNRDQAEASVISSRAIFDPNLSLSTNYSWDRNKSFFQGIPFEMKNRNTMGAISIGGTTATGTSYDLSSSYMRNYGEYQATSEGSPFGGTSIQDEYRSALSASVTQQLLKGHRFAYNIQAVEGAQQSLRQAELSYQQTRQSILSSTAQAYWNWIYQTELVEIRKTAVSVSGDAYRIGQEKYDKEDISALSLTQLELAWVQDQSSELEAVNAASQARTTLLLTMGRAPTELISPAPLDVSVPELSISLEQAVKKAMTSNIELAISRANVEQADLNARLAKHALLPTLTASFSAGLGAQGTDAASALGGVFREGNFPNMSVNGQFSMPLGNRAARGERRRSESSLAAQRVALMSLEQSIQAQIVQQVQVLNSAKKRVELADVNLRLARQSLTAEEAVFDAGRGLQKEVVEARNTLETARVDAVKSRTDYEVALVELRRLQGVLEGP